MSSAMVPVRSDSDSVPAGDTVSIPKRRCVLPLRPSKLAMGVIVLACAAATDPARINVADLVVEKVGAWNVSFRRIR
jgi:hypothetical protein